MDPDANPRRRRLMIAVTAAALILAVLTGLGICGLLRGPATAPDRIPDPTSTPTTLPMEPGPSGELGRLPDTANAELFARRVAEALFWWDTSSGHGPADYAQVTVNVGDPTGEEIDGLASDVRSYLPSPQAWAQLRAHQTRQWLTIDELHVPEAWADAEAQAVPGQLLPGTTAYTVTGTRHRTGIWGTEPVEAAHDVAFTIFLTCAPTFEHCRLLRLSALDNPLH